MNIENVATLVKKYVELSKKTDLQPSVSYIVDKSLNILPLRQIIEKELKGTTEYIKLFYIVFFLFEGDSMEVAKYKSENELYYLLLEEIGDKEYIDETCTNCDGEGRVECGECDTEGDVECDMCDGTGELEGDEENEECEYCDGEGERPCNYCDGDGYSECDHCEGTGEVASEDEYVTINSEYWVYYGDDVKDEIDSAMENSNNGLIEPYEILDRKKGSVMLLKTVSQTEEINIDEFESEYGSYYDAQGEYKVHTSHNINKFNLDYLFGIRNMGSKFTIR